MFDVEYQIAKSADNLEIVVCVLLVFKCAWFNVNVQCDQLENILKEYTYIIAYVTKLFGTLCIYSLTYFVYYSCHHIIELICFLRIGNFINILQHVLQYLQQQIHVISSICVIYIYNLHFRNDIFLLRVHQQHLKTKLKLQR